jgi:hypothetical protein
MKYSEQLRDHLTAAGKLPSDWDAAHKKAQKSRDTEDIKDYQKILEILIKEKITPKILISLHNSPKLKELFGEIIFLRKESLGGNKYFYFKRPDIYINAIIKKDSYNSNIILEYFELVKKTVETKIIFKSIETD